MTPIVLYSHAGGNTDNVAARLSAALTCHRALMTDQPDLDAFDTIIIVMPIVGDEELHPAVEDYLLNRMHTWPKRYCICELGNFLGLKYEGCRKIVEQILNQAGWQQLSCISVDSLPKLDSHTLERWIDDLRTL